MYILLKMEKFQITLQKLLIQKTLQEQLLSAISLSKIKINFISKLIHAHSNFNVIAQSQKIIQQILQTRTLFLYPLKIAEKVFQLNKKNFQKICRNPFSINMQLYKIFQINYKKQIPKQKLINQLTCMSVYSIIIYIQELN
ncbi:hypothetical protein TTHERM_000537059 (macronuclear) [Tetrahymena thermophila SB210]|uniref:Uncharacterized protein n=1 Tax=Tetrahymena thermophila (strain SB210) TaxID=312017 RepID=W7XE51_TETTS|nr:hypothetical protein TTHERM_000537059 [Tetrahymena thermophila SB210]EWS72216.1 hypothetical protein TTHERM_000537059 [Tetrahymena thermophila SB210]|eukprot:XP_012655259.1 hypothetical protein TTHERM_000537059 [Tetrahymena thermophila SB210]